MNSAFPKAFFDRLGLASLLDTTRRLQSLLWTARTVVWEGNGGNLVSYSIRERQCWRGFQGLAAGMGTLSLRLAVALFDEDFPGVVLQGIGAKVFLLQSERIMGYFFWQSETRQFQNQVNNPW